MKRFPTVIEVSAAILAGLLLGQRFAVNFWLSLAAGLLLAAGSFFLYRQSCSFILDQPQVKWMRFFICAAFFCLGLSRAALEGQEQGESTISSFVGTPVTMTAFVTDPPQESASRLSVRVQIDPEAARPGQPDNGKALLVFYRKGDIDLHYGDRITITGTPVLPPDSAAGFSYRSYLEQDGISVMLYSPKVEAAEGFSGSRVKQRIYQLRELLLERVYSLFSQPESALMAGILLGDESKISSEIEQAFQKTGTSHIIAISGTNFALLTWVLLSLIQQLIPHRLAPLLLLPLIAFYTILVGGSAAVERAAVMCGLGIVASSLGRTGIGLNNLAFTAAVMGLAKPSVLHDPGFQLSIMATLGILLFLDPMREGCARLLAKLFPQLSEDSLEHLCDGLSDLCLVSLSAQVLTVWISAKLFGRISLMSLPANFLIAPFQPFIMLGGFAVLVLSFLWEPLGMLAARVIWPAPALTIALVRLCASSGSASLYIDLSAAQAWFLCGGIVLLWYFRHSIIRFFKQQRTLSAASMLLGLAAVWVLSFLPEQFDDSLRLNLQTSKNALQLKIRTPENRVIVVADNLTNFAAQEALERRLFPLPQSIAAACLDIQEDWMTEKFLESKAVNTPELLCLNGDFQGETYTGKVLSPGMEMQLDGIRLRLAADFLGRKAWLLSFGDRTLLIPNGVPPERIFTREGLSPADVSLVLRGKRDDAERWENYWADQCPGSLCAARPADLASSSEKTLIIDRQGRIFITDSQ